jgi:hypothetical protein
MTIEQAFDSCARPVPNPRADARRATREPLGVCASCRLPLAWHFADDRNTKLPCDHADVVSARATFRRALRASLKASGR